jgi:hypothetical protein
MSGQSIGQIIGTVIGTIIGGPIGGAIGGSIGGSVGSSFDTLPTRYGPRLDDLRVQGSTYGSPIPIIYGTVALQGTIIWAQDIKEVKTETEEGGKGGPSQTTVTYSYFGTFAVAICEGPISGVLRIWAGPEKRLIYDGVALEGGSLRIYLGTEAQMPDPVIEADKGVGLTSAYRGTAYVVFEDYPLAKDGNRLPLLTIEVTTAEDGGVCGVDYTEVGVYPNNGRLYDRPPVKLGNSSVLVGGVSMNAQAMISNRNTAVDNDGNIYMSVWADSDQWYIKKISSTNPIQEEFIELDGWHTGYLGVPMAYDPINDVICAIQGLTTKKVFVQCNPFQVQAYSFNQFEKVDVAYYSNEARFCFMNSRPRFKDEPQNTVRDEENWGISMTFGAAKLIDCGAHGMAAAIDTLLVRSDTRTLLNGSQITNICASLYDPVRDRLIALGGAGDGYVGYYDFNTGETIVPVDKGAANRWFPVYSKLRDRIFYAAGESIVVMNPADLTPEAFPDECVLVPGSAMYYGDGVTKVERNGFMAIPIILPGTRNKIAVAMNGINSDVFTFNMGVNGAGVTLASIVADLSDRAGESRYDVAQLEADIVDGYIIARQMQVRAAIEALRPAYYFDAVESQGIIKFVKRGGEAVAVIDDDDLAAHDAGSDSPDPLKTVRRMEVELPRAISVKYMLAADDYNQAAKQARRLIGSSGDEQTVDVPLVMTDTKAQEVAEVNLHAPWAERLSYEFSLPRKYSRLEPTDLILVKGHLMRLTKVTATPRGVLQCEAVSDESAYYAPHVVVTETQQREQAISQPGVTMMELF